MSAAKFRSVIDEAVVRVVSRAGHARGVTTAELTPRIEAALDKYLFKSDSAPHRSEVKAFIDDIRADDLCLILACERGDQQAWEDLVRDFDQTVRSAARRMCGNAEDADDLAGSIWAELHGLRRDEEGRLKSKLSYYSGRGSLGGWLRAIVSQLAVDEFRKQARFVQVEEDREFDNLASEATGQDSAKEFASPSESPEELLDEKRTTEDLLAAVREAISLLPEEDRLMLKLYYFDDLKLKEVAATFGFHEATASRRLVKIQSRVRESVEDALKNSRGWTSDEVERHLSEAASRLGVGIEHLFRVIIFAAFVQEAMGGAVQ